MDRPALPKEDLFEASTMTFGEHLDELRRSLARAIVWLIIGTLVALAFVAKPVVRMIQVPLEQAIYQYKADRSLARFGEVLPVDATQDEAGMKTLKDFLLEKGLSWQQLYLLPPERMQGDTVPEPTDFTPTWVLVPSEASLNSHQVEEPFMIYLKASVVLGAVIASPMIFYHMWSFVAAGLYPHERRYVHVFLPLSVTLFVSGVALAFFAVLRFVLEFLLNFNSTLSVDLEPRLSYFMSFVMLLPLGFGIAFQLPLVMLFLQRIGIFETSAYENSWRIAVLVIAVLSMVLTPADPYSMLLMMIPLVILYFFGIALCRLMPRQRGLGSAAYDPQ